MLQSIASRPEDEPTQAVPDETQDDLLDLLLDVAEHRFQPEPWVTPCAVWRLIDRVNIDFNDPAKVGANEDSVTDHGDRR